MKNRLNPTAIALKDLPPEGQEFAYTRESGELNDILGDLIDQNAYKVSFRVTPVGNAYTLLGEVDTSLDLECSLCAMDLKFPVKLKLNELLVLHKPMHKGDQQTRANHAHEWESEGPDYILLDSDVFQVGEYVHEAIALSEPTRPLGKPDCDLTCENLPEPIKKALDPRLSGDRDPMRSNPFSVLEKMKLKS